MIKIESRTARGLSIFQLCGAFIPTRGYPCLDGPPSHTQNKQVSYKKYKFISEADFIISLLNK